MATEKRQIQFHSSMNKDKRNANFAYLRKNVLNESTPGLYPSKDYYLEEPHTGVNSAWDLLDVIGSDKADPNLGGNFDIKAIYDAGSDVRFFNLGSSSESNTALTGKSVLATAFGVDGIYVLCNDKKVYRPNHSNSNTPEIGDLLGNSLGIEVGGFDGLRYWWAGNNGIWRQLPGEDGVQVMDTVGFEFTKMDFYRDYMVLFAQRNGKDVYVLFWDKQNTVAFTKRIIIRNAQLLAGGVVDGVLMCVYSVGDTTNAKEYEGKIVVSAFDGENFKELNSIKAGREQVSITDTGLNGSSMDTGNEVMLFTVDDNERASKNPDLYQNYVYKVRNNGAIEVETLPATNGSANYANLARVFYNFNLVSVGSSGSEPAKIYINDETNRDFDDYEGYSTTEYITNFLNNPFNYHRLEGLSFAFEKFFKNTDNPSAPNGPEKMEVYCRTSERESFTLIGEITPALVIANVDTRQDPTVAATEIPVKKQIYQFTKRADGTTLPEYNEIQFKLKLFNGFSLIGAWYEYSYITRNIL